MSICTLCHSSLTIDSMINRCINIINSISWTSTSTTASCSCWSTTMLTIYLPNSNICTCSAWVCCFTQSAWISCIITFANALTSKTCNHTMSTVFAVLISACTDHTRICNLASISTCSCVCAITTTLWNIWRICWVFYTYRIRNNTWISILVCSASYCACWTSCFTINSFKSRSTSTITWSNCSYSFTTILAWLSIWTSITKSWSDVTVRSIPSWFALTSAVIINKISNC